jgi:hypothetical protein
MASLENGATQLFPLGAGAAMGSDDRGTTSIAAIPASPQAADRDDVDRGTALGTPSLGPVPTIYVVYNVTDRVLCRCFARGG